MSAPPDNPTPRVVPVPQERSPLSASAPLSLQIFEVIRDIRDPEHPYTIEELSVVTPSSITVTAPPTDSPGYGVVTIEFSPTVPHCSMASVIGLSIEARVRQSGLLRPKGWDSYYKLVVRCAEDSHATANEISKQLGDKERVAAALENESIKGVLASLY